MMSQQQEVVETIPVESQTLLRLRRMVNLIEKNESSHQRHNAQHNDAKVTYLGSLLGLPVELSNGIAVQTKHKTTIKLTYTGDLLVSKLAVQVLCMGKRASQCLTVEVCWHSRENIIWIDFNSMIT